MEKYDDNPLLDSIKDLCAAVTEYNDETSIRQGYQLLVSLHDMGLKQEQVYCPLLEYHNGLEEGPAREFAADLLDFIVGWCAPGRHIWREDGQFDRQI